ncbi:MAG: sigma-70 family RNA polymerase sigma factor [Reichenbachiella sp.]
MFTEMNELENYVKEALGGNKDALEKVVEGVQDMVYNLALRMLWHPEDAKDATQEILIKIVTSLTKYENKSKFTTWVYRVASNETLNYKAKHFKHQPTFDEFEQQLAHGQQDNITYTQNSADQKLLVNEAKIGCSHAMLQCLDRESRLSYVIGEILEFNSVEASIILDITPQAFRKRLSRIRTNVRSFVSSNCGLVNPSSNCRCKKKVDVNIKMGMIDPNNLLFTKNKGENLIEDIDKITDEVALFQSNPSYHMPDSFLNEVKRIITTSSI